MDRCVVDPMDVYQRGLKDPDSLSEEELIVYLLIELETEMDMEGWDHFFTTDKLRYYPKLKSALQLIGDLASLRVINGYEAFLRSYGVPMRPDAITAFFRDRSAEIAHDRDWRAEKTSGAPHVSRSTLMKAYA